MALVMGDVQSTRNSGNNLLVNEAMLTGDPRLNRGGRLSPLCPVVARGLIYAVPRYDKGHHGVDHTRTWGRWTSTCAPVYNRLDGHGLQIGGIPACPIQVGRHIQYIPIQWTRIHIGM